MGKSTTILLVVAVLAIGAFFFLRSRKQKGGGRSGGDGDGAALLGAGIATTGAIATQTAQSQGELALIQGASSFGAPPPASPQAPQKRERPKKKGFFGKVVGGGKLAVKFAAKRGKAVADGKLRSATGGMVGLSSVGIR